MAPVVSGACSRPPSGLDGRPQPQQVRLPHVTGIRTLLALWIVCGHYLAREPATYFDAVACRSFMAVDVFVVMSGFVTHWSYSGRFASGTLGVTRFYIQRLVPILVTTYVAMLASLAITFAVPALREGVLP
eukprot:CAMPEP_0203902508 /NCGR_PEP_ID=MMETSP0359-20131031/44581_1 /ASSEMBLY_ACC=CAM_ASM_000338 /TAXON_ID=268821 /ORGANISM="Scrippsiella Hangoei, Strain SHTV-5" /LENGTH=130 /DNA_ID=CAMNT_0050826381 /DNA_START=31 /DNA_END=420 /DNA_ORIENTATION=+